MIILLIISFGILPTLIRTSYQLAYYLVRFGQNINVIQNMSSRIFIVSSFSSIVSSGFYIISMVCVIFGLLIKQKRNLLMTIFIIISCLSLLSALIIRMIFDTPYDYMISLHYWLSTLLNFVLNAIVYFVVVYLATSTEETLEPNYQI